MRGYLFNDYIKQEKYGKIKAPLWWQARNLFKRTDAENGAYFYREELGPPVSDRTYGNTKTGKPEGSKIVAWGLHNVDPKALPKLGGEAQRLCYPCQTVAYNLGVDFDGARIEDYHLLPPPPGTKQPASALRKRLSIDLQVLLPRPRSALQVLIQRTKRIRPRRILQPRLLSPQVTRHRHLEAPMAAHPSRKSGLKSMRTRCSSWKSPGRDLRPSRPRIHRGLLHLRRWCTDRLMVIIKSPTPGPAPRRRSLARQRRRSPSRLKRRSPVLVHSSPAPGRLSYRSPKKLSRTSLGRVVGRSPERVHRKFVTLPDE